MNNPTVSLDDVKVSLSWAAESRRAAQAKADTLAVRYERRKAKLSIQAATAEMFAAGEGKLRAAKTEDERKWAAQCVMLADRRFCKLEADYREAQRTLQFYSDQQANFRLLAHLIGAESIAPF